MFEYYEILRRLLQWTERLYSSSGHTCMWIDAPAFDSGQVKPAVNTLCGLSERKDLWSLDCCI